MKITVLLLFTILRIQATWLPKIIWTYWHEPIQPDTYLELFHLNHMRYKGDWDLRLLNGNNFMQVLNQIPDFKGLPIKFQSMVVQQQADFIRIQILHHFGGVRLDYSTIMTENLSWVQISEIRNHPEIVNMYGDEPDLLLFSYQYGRTQKYTSPENNRIYWLSPRLQMWFIAAKPQAKFLGDILDVVYDTQEHKKDNPSYWKQLLKKQKIDTRSNDRDYFFFGQIFQYLFQTKQREFDAKRSSTAIQRQLAVKYYKIWHLPSWLGPYGYLKNYNQYQYMNKWLLSQVSKSQLPKKGLPTQFFIKLVTDERNYFKKFAKTEGILDTITRYNERPMRKFQLLCFQKNLVHKNSLIVKDLFNENEKVKDFRQVNYSTVYTYPCDTEIKLVRIVLIWFLVQVVLAVLYCCWRIYWRNDEPKMIKLSQEDESICFGGNQIEKQGIASQYIQVQNCKVNQ